MSYLTLAGGPGHQVRTDLEVKRSRFITVLGRTDTESGARELIAACRKEFHDARHHCSAFVIGRDIARSNDDGEPAGTAGIPMLEVLRGHGLSDVCAVVIRYFGGILLGAPGLVRAYSAAVQTAVRAATLVRRRQLASFTVALPHAQAGRIESELRTAGFCITGASYGAQAVLEVATDQPVSLAALVAQLTAGQVQPTPAGQLWVDQPS